ncbi:MAG TPA: hypothetical protein VEI02_11930, partial [Planctomycetota bacterium]|nr:hypothetical protein [Planctomycetota bacterium]
MSRQSLAALVVLAALAAAIVIAGPCGDPIDAPRGPPAPPADLRSRTEGDRPVLAPPTDPLPSASSAAPLRAENSGSRTDDGAPSAPAATLFVRATDARGRPRARLEVEVRDRDPDLGPARLLAPP